MSLINALNVGKSALAVHQAAIGVTSNNVANAGNPDYTRQVARIVPGQEQYLKPGVLVGSGVNLIAVERQIDEALEGRIRGSISDGQAALVRQQWLGRVEAIFNELADDDLSTLMSTFFNSWSNLANNPGDIGLRQVVLQNGDTLAGAIRSQRRQISGIQSDLDKRLATLADEVDALAQQMADLNVQIVTAENAAVGSANSLRDQRDAVLRRLAELIDVRAYDIGDGNVNVLIGSEPLVLGSVNRGIAVREESTADGLRTYLASRFDGGALSVSSGQLGGTLALRGEIDGVASQLDALAGALIFELNRLHSSGQGLEGHSQITASGVVADTAAALNSAAAGLPFAPTNGSFVVHVRQKSTGLVSSTLVQVDLDGLGNNDTSLDSLAAALDAIEGVSASIVTGRLRLGADSSDIELAFSQDSSGVLAALGINTFFTGRDAGDIAVRADLKSRPALLAAALNGQAGDNQTARAIAEMESRPLASLGGNSLKGRYEAMINGVAVANSAAKTAAQAASAVHETLTAQREALSGVSLDEEAINLIRHQRAFQGAARVISAVDELMRTLISMV